MGPAAKDMEKQVKIVTSHDDMEDPTNPVGFSPSRREIFVQQDEEENDILLARTTVDAEKRYKTEDWPRIKKYLDRKTPLMRNAAAPDIADIVALANKMCLSKAKKQGKEAIRSSSGFYLSHLSDQDYTEYKSKAEHFLVLHHNGKLIGFILAYSSTLIDQNDPNEEVDVYIRDHVVNDPNRPFVLVKQLVVDQEFKHCGFAELLYMEVYARVVHLHSDDATPWSVYTEITADHPGLRDFHTLVGYPQEVARYDPQKVSSRSYRADTRLILANHHVTDSLNELAARFASNSTLDTRPVDDASSMLDPHCVGVGVCLYWIEPPDPSGTFYADVRIMLKWRKPAVEKLYEHPRLRGPGIARTEIDMKAHGKELRFPRYAFNEFNTETTQHYAYIDRHDPPDVITMQKVVRGNFIGKSLDLRNFPADTQMLEFKFRMWDNDPDDRCRYFRQLYYVDNTAWQLGVKRVVDVPTCSFLAAQVELGKDPVAGTSFLAIRIPCVRNTGYYLRTVAVPLFFISSLTLTSIGLDELSSRIELNTVLLLTNVAYLFVTKDETPRTSHVTKLDLVTYFCFLAPWFLIVLNYIAFRVDMSLTLADNISYMVCGTVVGFIGFMIVFMRTKYIFTVQHNSQLGEFDRIDKKKSIKKH